MSDPFYRSKEWHRLRTIVLKRDPTCRTPGCGRQSVAVDHILQRSKGGADHPSNLRGLCTQCHNQRRQGGEPRAWCDTDGRPRQAGHWWNRPQNGLNPTRGKP
ncbi:HNH endonuclease signature motif containing protein [Rhodovarius lipocyclicus]|uniref:HNH endonuclease signature motif containing protein n=1 Tax=Rhodovarius lipocyclicus TaxID=268410 RepID=UPI00135C323E|nr:HNH endonuclease signature motif containing protein [Rhodovarius lipocyclicus]